MPSRTSAPTPAWLRHQPSHVQVMLEPRVEDTPLFHTIPRISEATSKLERAASLAAEVYAPRDAEFNVRVCFIPSPAALEEFGKQNPRLKRSKTKSALDNTYYGPEPESSYVITVRIYNEEGLLEAMSFCSFIHKPLWRTYSINCDMLDTEQDWPLLKPHDTDAEDAPLCMGARVDCEVRRTVIFAFDDEEDSRRERQMEEVDHDTDDGPPVVTFTWLRKDPSTRLSESQSSSTFSALSSVPEQGPSQRAPEHIPSQSAGSSSSAHSPPHPKHILVPDSPETSGYSPSALSSDNEETEPLPESLETPPQREHSPFIPPGAARAGRSRKPSKPGPAARARARAAQAAQAAHAAQAAQAAQAGPSTSTPAQSQRPRARPRAPQAQQEVPRHAVSSSMSSMSPDASQQVSTSASAIAAAQPNDDVVSEPAEAVHEQADERSPVAGAQSQELPGDDEWQDYGDAMDEWPAPSATGGAQDDSGASVLVCTAPQDRPADGVTSASAARSTASAQRQQESPERPSHSARSQSDSSEDEVAEQMRASASQGTHASHVSPDRSARSTSRKSGNQENPPPRAARAATRTASTEPLSFSPEPRHASILSEARLSANGAAGNRASTTSFRDPTVFNDARASSFSAPAQRADSARASRAPGESAHSNGVKRSDSVDQQQRDELASMDKRDLVSKIMQLKKDYDSEQKLGDGFYQTTLTQREELIRFKDSRAREQRRVEEEHASAMRRQAAELARVQSELAALQTASKATISELEAELEDTQRELGTTRAELRTLRHRVERLETPDRDAVRRRRVEELEHLEAEQREGSSKRLRTS